jgi:glycosyltransferase involved in cell wall biosynthesis
MLNEQDVIIPALNEEFTVGNIIRVFRESGLVRDVIVVVDALTTDRTAEIARKYGAIVGHSPETGKGQGVSFVIKTFRHLSDRIILSDADYVRFPRSVPSRLACASRGMHVIVPQFPPKEDWEATAIGKVNKLTPVAWSMNSGIRSLPRELLTPELHGYLMETQINNRAKEQKMPVTYEYVQDLVAPLRFTPARMRAMQADGEFGRKYGIIK